MANPIREKLKAHARGYAKINAYEADLQKIYHRARFRIERELSSFMQRKGASFTGPRLVSLFDDLNEMFPEFEEEYRETYEHALEYMAHQNYAAALYDMGLKENIVGTMDRALFRNMRDDGFQHIAGATLRMKQEVVSELRRISARVMRESALTGEPRATVSRRLVAELLYGPDSKLTKFQFIDAAGRRWQTDKYFQMLGRTLLHNNARECYLAGCAKSGSDIVTVSISGNCCKHCGKWENVLLSISGKTSGLPTLQDAMDEGLFHPNCTHRLMAVPESVAREYYDKHGKPVEGLNTDNGEPVEPPYVFESKRDKHLEMRNQQWLEAYDSRRDKWYQDIITAGGTKEIAGELVDLYTPAMAKLGKPPRVTFFNNSIPNYANSSKTLNLNLNNVYDMPSTRKHEFTHWWHYQIQRKYPIIRDELEEAAKKDLARIKKLYSKKKRDYDLSDDDTKNKLALKLFHVEKWNSLSADEQQCVKRFVDSVGSVSSGKLGGRHGNTYEENREYFTGQNTNPNRVSFGEIIAAMGEEENLQNAKLKFAFPEIWAIFQKYRRMK